MYVTSELLAEIIGITSRRVRQLVEEKVIERDPKTKKYDLRDCVRRYIEYKVNAELKCDADYEKERALHEKAKREKAELLLAVMKGELHEAEAVEKAMTDMVINAKTKLRGVAIKIAPSLLAQEEIYVVENIVAEAIDECLTELTEYTPRLFSSPNLIALDDSDSDMESSDGNE